jgi:hypothetical protein
MGVLKTVSMPQYRDFSSVSLGALGVLAVKIDLRPEFSHGVSLMVSTLCGDEIQECIRVVRSSVGWGKK